MHADYFPGSWLRTGDGIRVIDPEFSFPGDPELDLGCAVAHMALAGQPREIADRFLAAYGPASADLDPIWLARYAAVEMMRRLIGVAQSWLARSKADQPTNFHLEAAIAMHHCASDSVDATDWSYIVRLYDRLLQLRESPVNDSSFSQHLKLK